jgi:hypothetical protein
MKKKGLLVVLLALVLATAGVAYAAWQATLTMNANVNTGIADANFYNVFTDDDGGDYIGEEPGASTVSPGTLDPVAPAQVNADGELLNAALRADRGVGSCGAGMNEANDTTMTVVLSNVYPGYTCTVWSYVHNEGSVPMAVQHITTTGGGLDLATWDILAGPRCGDVVEAGGLSAKWASTIHVGDDVSQNASLTMTRTIDLVNWNEFSWSGC